jgi:hypothetical protein
MLTAAPDVPGGTETDFVSLDKRNRIGYDCVLKLCRSHGLPGTLRCNAAAHPSHSRECAKRDERPTSWLAATQTRSLYLHRR